MKMTKPIDFRKEYNARVTWVHWWDIPIATLLYRLKLKKLPHLYKIIYITGMKLRHQLVTADEFAEYPVSSMCLIDPPRGYTITDNANYVQELEGKAKRKLTRLSGSKKSFLKGAGEYILKVLDIIFKKKNGISEEKLFRFLGKTMKTKEKVEENGNIGAIPVSSKSNERKLHENEE